MHGTRTFIDGTVRIQKRMERAPARPSLKQLDTSDLDDPMTFPYFESGRFRIEDDLSHKASV
jgi:hypothetical protein